MNTKYSDLPADKKVYFASDFHLGAPSRSISLTREKKIVEWLGEVSSDAYAIFLVGDIFDFWFEYKKAAPKGYVRFLGKLATLADQGIKIILFSGNHDLWFKDYLAEEIGVDLYHEPTSFQIGEKKFYIGHGDGLGPGGRKYKFYKRVFTNSICQWMFRWLHPDIGLLLGSAWSGKSRTSQDGNEEIFLEDEERLVIHSRKIEETHPHNYYVFGHLHLAVSYPMTDSASYVGLGEWVVNNNYASFDGEQMNLELHQNE